MDTPSVASANSMVPVTVKPDDLTLDRGHLDLAVELSTRDVTAGEQFTVFVVVRNPFAKPVWIHKVHVSLPSELYLAERKAILRASIWRRWLAHEKPTSKVKGPEKQLRSINRTLNRLQKGRLILKREDILEKLKQTKQSLDDLEEVMKDPENQQTGEVYFTTGGDTTIGNMKIGTKRARIHLGSDKDNNANIGSIEIVDPWQVRQLAAKSQEVELESSLPSGAALQPGSTVVFSARLDTLRSILFTPSKYRLNFNVVYSFVPPKTVTEDPFDVKADTVFQNTIPYELLLRSSVFSILYGSVLGGIFGSIARLFQITPKGVWPTLGWSDLASDLISVLLAMILSSAAIVFVARKSDAQSFVSVEDFWGGVLTGFLVGYTGTSFFESIAGFNINGRIGK
jgi:hypothetical protein